MYYNVSEVPWILLLFVLTFCDIFFFSTLMYNTGHCVQSIPESVSIPKISLLLALIKKYVDKKLIYMLFCGKF